MVEHLPKARLAVFEHSGHVPHLEEPENFNTLLANFTRGGVPRNIAET